MEFMTSERGQKLIVLHNFTFRKDRIQSNCAKYRCSNSKCKAALKVDHSETVLLEAIGEHNHGEANNLTIKKIQNSAKRKAVEDISVLPNKIINLEIGDAVHSATSNEVANIRHAIYRSRRKQLPPLLKNINEVFEALENMDIQTSAGEKFLTSVDSYSEFYLCEK